MQRLEPLTSARLAEMQQRVHGDGESVLAAATAVFGSKRRYYKAVAFEDRIKRRPSTPPAQPRIPDAVKDERLGRMRELVQNQGYGVVAAAAAVYGNMTTYCRYTTPEQRETVRVKPVVDSALREQQFKHLTHLVKVQLWPLGKALVEVYGHKKNYYRYTTPEQRKTIYCKPCKAASGLHKLAAHVRPDVAARFAASCKQTGKSQARVLTRLVMEFITLNPVEPTV